jgi:formylglycine-generating enzyme required for sulfatase activity
MRRRTLFSLLLLTSVLVGPTTAWADQRGVFVTPSTGLPIGSVWGVFIGVSEYQQKELNLKYADKDAQALHAFFVAQFKGRIPADQFRLVTNKQATRGRILKEVSEVLRLAQPEDLVIVSLAQHGLPDASGHDLYFLTYNSDANLPEDQGVSRDDLLKQIARSKARKIVLLIDACHAGAFGASSTLLAMRNANAADINRMLVSMGQAQDGIAVLSASSAAERSQEGPQFCGGHGAFTCALLNGLKGAADNDGNGLVQMRELYDHTYREVKRLTTGYQNPEIQGRYDNSLPLAATGKGPTKPIEAGTAPEPSAALTQKQQELAALEDEARRAEEETKQAELDRQIAEKRRQIEEQKKKKLEVASLPTPSLPRQTGREITGKDGAPMVLVPDGEFQYGDNNQRLSLPAFYMDKFEVSTKLYAAFMQATSRAAPERWNEASQVSDGDRPVIGVDWNDADAYCRYYGKRLPTEQEWEKAARGTDGRKYPWGNEEPTSRHANFDPSGKFERKWQGYATLTAAGEHEAGKSPYGIYDMAGNVWEWTSSDYNSSAKVFRGGA